MPDPFDTDSPDPGDAQAGGLPADCWGGPHMEAGAAPAGGPVIDRVLANAIHNLVHDTLAPDRLHGVIDETFTQAHELAQRLPHPWGAMLDDILMLIGSKIDQDALAADLSRRLLRVADALLTGRASLGAGVSGEALPAAFEES